MQVSCAILLVDNLSVVLIKESFILFRDICYTKPIRKLFAESGSHFLLLFCNKYLGGGDLSVIWVYSSSPKAVCAFPAFQSAGVLNFASCVFRQCSLASV